MEREQRFVLDARTLTQLQHCADYFAARQQQAYLVGGSVRNLLLQQPSVDWDIVISGDAPQAARHLADILHGFPVHMHEKASRVVVKQEGQEELIFDLAPLRNSTIAENLAERDFTINAIALPLASLVEYQRSGTPLELIDPLHGNADLQTRTLRAVNNAVFRADPLRLLRAVRFLLRYQLTLDPLTEQYIQHDAPLLPQAASERIHDELYALLGMPQGTAHLRLLDQLGLFMVLFPEFLDARGMRQPELHHWDVLEHSLEAVSMLEQLATILQAPAATIATSPLENAQQDLQKLQQLLREAEQQGIFSFARLTSPAMKLAALLHDIGKPPTYTVDEAGTIRFYGHPQAGVPLAHAIMRRLAMSTSEHRLVHQIVANHMRPGQLSHDTVSERAIRRYFVELGHAGLAVGLVSLSDHLAMRGPEPLTDAWQHHLGTICLLFTRYIQERERILPPRLIQGDELIHRLNLKPGPTIGWLLEAISEGQAEGRVHSKDEALWLAEELLAQRKQKTAPQEE